MYEAMALRTGLLSTVAYYVQGDNQLESLLDHTTDSVIVPKLMAKMLQNGTEIVDMDFPFHAFALGRCDEVDFDIALFTNLMRDHMDFHGSHEEYRDAKAKPFARMVELERHRKIVNIDDPMAPLFTAQGNPDVPVVTYAMENKRADVHSLKIGVSLFETLVLVKPPQGILEISPLLIIIEDNIGGVLGTLVVNKSCDILNVAAVKVLGFGGRRKALLQDIAISTGAEHQASDLELLIENTLREQLGVSIKWNFTKESTAFPYLIFYNYHFDTNLLKGTITEPKITTAAAEPFLLIAVRGQEVERPPVWLMRQAGRYKKSYQILCENLFLDILTPLPGMNIPFDIVKGKGPIRFNPLGIAADVDQVTKFIPKESVSYVGQALTILHKEESNEPAVLGFGGTFSINILAPILLPVLTITLCIGVRESSALNSIMDTTKLNLEDKVLSEADGNVMIKAIAYPPLQCGIG
ncbi:hypothetical protein NE237_013958 [Protea cynaroides]|uniref:Uroporphyrinogen decarboxylase (URO-D) domain-containing protein n=1 Tax=Protea cynaroides TaxID=273540 RepID=A0A9Q0H328_9MAGN|nr:hypothetical protein NE237_013958 [Protea cynaroides]